MTHLERQIPTDFRAWTDEIALLPKLDPGIPKIVIED